MGTTIKLYPLFFLTSILYLSSTIECGHHSHINDEYKGVLYKTKNIVNENHQGYDHYNVCTYNSGKDPNIRKNIEEIIKVLVKDSLPPAMETPDEQEYDIARDIQVAANKIIIQLTLHASRITQKFVQSMEKPNDLLGAVDTEMQHCGLIENQNRIKEIQELADKISQLSNYTKELTNTINMSNKRQNQSMEIMNNKISLLEKTRSDSRDMDVSSTTTQKPVEPNILSTTSQKPVEPDVLSTTSQKPVEPDVLSTTTPKSIEPKVLNPIVPEQNVPKFSFLCDMPVPASVVAKPEPWQQFQRLEKDDLDVYMINKTGCSFMDIRYGESYLGSTIFDGEELMFRVAVRTRGAVALKLWRNQNSKHTFYVGDQAYQFSRDHAWDQIQPDWALSTPGLLAEDRYVPLYFKFSNGKLTAGVGCTFNPSFERALSLQKGESLFRSIVSWSYIGAKFLYDCPADVTVQ